jgi:hypothetical protein
MKNLINIAQRYSTGKVVFILFVITMIVYITMLSYSIPLVSAFAPELPLFDLSPAGYSFAYANELLMALGAEGRTVYMTTQLPLDFMYPGLFSITYSLMLVWILGKLVCATSKVHYLALIPFLAGIFDYIENVYIIKMIVSFPDLQESTVEVGSLFTLLKSGFTTVFFILLTVGFLLLLKKKLSTENH